MNRVKVSIFTATIVLAMTFTQSFAQEKGSFTDARDKKTYKTVKIGEQTWIAENLNYNASGSKCYDNKEANCKKYGRLYDWNEAMKACPAGWHLASCEEWDVLRNFTGNAGKVKAKNEWKIYDFSEKSPEYPKCKYEEVKINTHRPYYPSKNQVVKIDTTVIERDYCTTDEYDFAALPGGQRDFNGNFSGIGGYGFWWSDYSICYIFMSFNFGGWGMRTDNSNKSLLLSVRCIKD